MSNGESYLGKKISIPISEEFMNILFDTYPFDEPVERLQFRVLLSTTLFGEIVPGLNVGITPVMFFENQFKAVEPEVKSNLKFYQQSNIDYTLEAGTDLSRLQFGQRIPRSLITKIKFIASYPGSAGDVNFIIYGKKLGPQGPFVLVIEWKISKPYKYTVKLVDAFVERIKAIDNFVAQQPNISVRMLGNRPVTQNVVNLIPQLPLPENVLRSFVQPAVGPATAASDPALALKPLIKNGGVRRKYSRRSRKLRRKTRKQKPGRK